MSKPTDSEQELECAPSLESIVKKTWGPATHEPITVDHPSDLAPLNPEIKEIAAAFNLITLLQGPLPLDLPSEPSAMSVNVTTTAPATNPLLNGGMRGVPLAIFDGTMSQADEFWAQFH